MTATDELRRMLDERGVKHESSERSVRWRDRNGVIMQAFPLASGELGLEVWSCTPEQAIAATLGVSDATRERQDDGTCHSTTSDNAWCFACSECGKSFPRNQLHLAHNHGEIKFCPNCGRKVVDE